MYERANCSGSGRASASTNAVSLERFTSASAVDAVTPTVPLLDLSACDGCGRLPHVFNKNVHGRTVHDMTRRSSHSEGAHRVPLIIDANRSPMGREVGGHLRRRQRQFPLRPIFWSAREQEP